jgi:AraC-like DNA-binding protein
MMFYFTEPNEWKYNSYIDAKHPDWPFLQIHPTHNEDPLGIRAYIDWLLPVYFITYMFFSIRLFLLECKKNGISLFQTTDNKIRNLRNTTIHFILIIVIFIVVKSTYHGDLGDQFISAYISFMILLTGFRITNSSTYFNQTASFLDFPLMKYMKSTLQDTDKNSILLKIETEMVANKYYLSNLASLEGLSKTIIESKHNVSQVINEKLNMNFFEVLAKYRVEEAKRIILADHHKKVTIEDLADQVGYNSKSSFNTAFKKFTGMTPSEFREQGIQD